jgi:transposase
MQQLADPAHDRSNAPEVQVTLGVDTHADVHVGVALDHLGRRLGTHTIPTTPAGYAALVAWAGSFGPLEGIGLEGTGSYGAGLARWLRERGFPVLEVERPHRQTRRRRGTSDPIDAAAAARAVLAGTATGRSTSSPSVGWPGTRAPAPTPPGARPRARRCRRSSGA